MGFTSWLERARELVPTADRRELRSPLRLLTRILRFVGAHALGRRARDEAVVARDPRLVSLLADLFRALGKHYFRLRVEGLEHVPRNGPVLLVANHNGGLLPTDAFFTVLVLHDHQGAERAVNVLVHDFFFEDPLFHRYARRLGLVRAGHEGAREALAGDGCLLVYPGSDLDTYRPFWERDRVCLGGRKGFVRLALETGVPIVPVVSAGTHEQLVVLSRGSWLAKVTGIHALARADVLPWVFALPWGIVPGFVPYLLLPAQTTVAFGAPMTWNLGSDAVNDQTAQHVVYRDVEAAMQGMLDELYRGRRLLRGRPSDR
jgi:1-acyl-sn-glycerol-3-phosphate acyltransferase